MTGFKRIAVVGLLVGIVLVVLGVSARLEAGQPSVTNLTTPVHASTALDMQRVRITQRDSYYHLVPANADAMVYLFHGGGGQATDWFKRTEARYLLGQLVAHGYGVVALDSTLGLNEGWSNPMQSSAGLDRFDWVRADLKQRGLFRDSMREYAIGASGGGNFVSFVQRRCDLEAIVIVSSMGKKDGLVEIQKKPAVLFAIGAHDANNPLTRVRSASDKLNKHGVPSEVSVMHARPITAEMMARIDGLSVDDGKTIVQRLKSGGVVGPSGVVNPAALKYDKGILGEFARYKKNIGEQLDIAAGGHAFDRQHVPVILTFFDTHR